jgi:glycosyltransferase involved in cell wall biosynthesis
MPAIRELSKRMPIRVVFVGSGPVFYEGCEVEVREWSESTEVAEMLRFDVGIMPLPDEPWTRGKCAFKLIQYMACGLPVVASPVGMNNDVVTHGSNGFLVASTSQWLSAFQALANSVELRRQMGAAGRRIVEQGFTTSLGGAKLLRAIQSVPSVASAFAKGAHLNR